MELPDDTGKETSKTDKSPIRPVTDILSHYSQEQAVELLKEVFNNSLIGLYILQDQRFQIVSREFTRIGGYAEKDLIGMPSEQIVFPDDREKVRVNAKKMLKGERSTPYEFRIINSDGMPRWVKESVVSVPYNGRRAVLGNFMDITEQKNTEEELNKTLAQLKRSNSELEQFAYVASHDLQEPLRMVASYTQLLARRYQGRLDDDADEFIGYAVDGANRMQHLINDLLTYSRVTTRGKEFIPTDCEKVFDNAIANLQAAIEESGADIRHEPLPEVLADATQLSQIFQNLIGNAIKFRGNNPPVIHVSAKQIDDEWLFSFNDNGIGIETEYQDRIFLVFQRLHSKAEYPGTGIGLALCKKIAERHGGRIWVESEPGKGSTFNFTIQVKGGNNHD